MPKYDYNIAVIGAGSGGLVASYIAAAVKAKVALIEKHQMGGDCLNTGCVPSKAFIRTAKAMHDIHNAAKFGLKNATATVDFAAVMASVKTAINTIAPHDSVDRYERLGVNCYQGTAQLIDKHTIKIHGPDVQTITAKNIIIATGGRPFIPPIDGLADINPLTSDTVWDLTECPKKLVVLGGGPIGCELAQSFARLGSDVTIVEKSPHLLSKEDQDVSDFIKTKFEHENITVLTDHTAVKVEPGQLTTKHGDNIVTISFDHMLVALGRRAHTDDLGLAELGCEINKNGTIDHDALMRTLVDNIYVCGDVAGPYQFTHTASHQAWYACINALFAPFKTYKVDYSVIPWCTFTDPEVAHVGHNEQSAKNDGIDYEATTFDLSKQDRAVTERANHGFIKILTVTGKDKILGATIVGPHAGDVMAEIVMAMKHNIGLNKILSTIHAYPTLSEMNKAVAGRWKQNHAPRWALSILEWFHAWRR